MPFYPGGAEVTAINASPDGRNINEGCGALHPEALGAEVARRRAGLGLAFDGDADRCAFVDEDGRTVMADLITLIIARGILEYSSAELS